MGTPLGLLPALFAPTSRCRSSLCALDCSWCVADPAAPLHAAIVRLHLRHAQDTAEGRPIGSPLGGSSNGSTSAAFLDACPAHMVSLRLPRLLTGGGGGGIGSRSTGNEGAGQSDGGVGVGGLAILETSKNGGADDGAEVRAAFARFIARAGASLRALGLASLEVLQAAPANAPTRGAPRAVEQASDTLSVAHRSLR